MANPMRRGAEEARAINSAPIISLLENHSQLAPIFRPVFEAHDKGLVRLAVTTVTLAEVLTGPLSADDEVLAERYRFTLKSWFVVDLDPEMRADALVTHDRDFSAMRDLRVLGARREPPSN